jgi:hypothetical protein
VRVTAAGGVELAVTDHRGPSYRPGTGHLANLELPVVVDAQVEEFLATVEVGAGVGGRA